MIVQCEMDITQITGRGWYGGQSKAVELPWMLLTRGGICPCRQCRRQCKIFASGVNFSIFTHFLCFFLLKLLKLGEIDGVKFLARKSGGVNFWTNSMSEQQMVNLFLFVLYGSFLCSNRLGEYPEGSVDHRKPLIVNHYKFVQPSWLPGLTP